MNVPLKPHSSALRESGILLCRSLCIRIHRTSSIIALISSLWFPHMSHKSLFGSRSGLEWHQRINTTSCNLPSAVFKSSSGWILSCFNLPVAQLSIKSTRELHWFVFVMTPLFFMLTPSLHSCRAQTDRVKEVQTSETAASSSDSRSGRRRLDVP